MVEKVPRKTSKQIPADLQAQGATVSSRTTFRRLNENGFRFRKTRPGYDKLIQTDRAKLQKLLSYKHVKY